MLKLNLIFYFSYRKNIQNRQGLPFFTESIPSKIRKILFVSEIRENLLWGHFNFVEKVKYSKRVDRQTFEQIYRFLDKDKITATFLLVYILCSIKKKYLYVSRSLKLWEEGFRAQGFNVQYRDIFISCKKRHEKDRYVDRIDMKRDIY